MSDNDSLMPAFGVLPPLPWSVQVLTSDAGTAAGVSSTDVFWQALRSNRDFTQVHVPVIAASVWQRLMQALRVPVKFIDGERPAIQVVDVSRLFRNPDGTLSAELWTPGEAGMRWEPIRASEVIIGGLPGGKRWLGTIKEAVGVEVRRHHLQTGLALSRQEVAPYLDALFALFERHIRKHCDLRLMRRRVAIALALDAEAIRIAYRLQNYTPACPASHPYRLRLREYNLVLTHKASFAKLDREMPQLVPLYGALLLQEDFADMPEPAEAIRLHLQSKGLGPSTWRLLAKAGKRLFVPMRYFYKGWPALAMLDYLKFLSKLGFKQEPDPSLIWGILSRYGNTSAPRLTYADMSARLLGSIRDVARGFTKAADRQAALPDLDLVLEWVEVTKAPALDKMQRRAGWSWLVKQARDWAAQRVAEIELAGKSWPVPSEPVECGPYVVTILPNAMSLWVEARAMRHCADQFTLGCLSGTTLVVSLSRISDESRRVATARYDLINSRWTLRQVRGFANAEPETGVKPVVERVEEYLNDCAAEARRASEAAEALEASELPPPEDPLAALRRALFKHGITRCLAVDSPDVRAAAVGVADGLAKFPRMYWYVWQLNGGVGYGVKVLVTSELLQILAAGGVFEVHGGPFEDLETAEAARDAHLKAAQETRTPEWAEDAATGLSNTRRGRPNNGPLAMPRSSRPVCEIAWWWSPIHARRERCFLSSNRGGGVWILWVQYYDDNWNRWEPAEPVGYMKKQGISAEVAASLLFESYLTDEREEDTDRFSEVLNAGLLTDNQVEAIADRVWVMRSAEMDEEGTQLE
jgi:hypothetical protein